jgi:hypothetical protein
MSEDKTPSFPPRQGDLPRDQIQVKAQDIIDMYTLQGVDVDLHFKFTCEHCGQRCTFNEKNTLWEDGECFACGKKTEVNFAGFSLHIHLGKRK